MMTHRLRFLTALAVIATATSSLSFAQTPIYREVFGKAAGTGNTSLSTYGWFAYGDTTATDFSTSFSNFGVSPESAPNTGSFSNVNSLASINSGAATPADNGRIFAFTSAPFLLYTNEYTVDRSTNSISSITYDERNDSVPVSVALQIGGNWFVSQSLALGGTGTSWSVETLDFPTATWTTLNFTAGSNLSAGSATILPGGDITAFGIYSGAAGARLDGFTINVVPEPTSLALAGFVGLGIAALRRQRR